MFPFSKCSQGRFCNVLTATEDLLRNRTKASNPWEEVGSHRLCLLSCPGTGTEAPRQAAGALIWLEAPGEAGGACSCRHSGMQGRSQGRGWWQRLGCSSPSGTELDPSWDALCSYIHPCIQRRVQMNPSHQHLPQRFSLSG